MMRFKKLLGEICCFIKHFSKKAYTKGLVIASAGMITVLLLGTNGFNVKCKTIPTDYGENNNEEDISAFEDIIDSDITIQENIDLSDINEKEDPQLIREEETEAVFLTAGGHQTQAEAVTIYTEQDYTALINIVEAEATGEDVIGKVLVANVVLNRVKSSRFPNAIYDVIYQEIDGKAQFSPIDDGRMGTLEITESTYEAVKRALEGEDYSSGALFFVARALASDNAVRWFDNSLKKVTEHGGHEFFTYN